MRQNSVFDLVGAGRRAVSTVGPFVEVGRARRARRRRRRAAPTWTRPASRDVHPPRVRGVRRRRRARSGARLLTAMGYDFAPGALAGRWRSRRRAPEAVRVDVGYYALGGGAASLSAGTRESLVGRDAGRRPRVPRRRACARVRPAERVRSFTRRGQARARRSRSAAPSTSALPASYPGPARGQRVPRLVRAAGAAAAGGLVGRRVRAARPAGARPTMRFVGRAGRSALAPGPEPGTTPGGRSWIAAEAFDAAGASCREVHLAGVDGYDFTAASWPGRRSSR